MRFRRLLADRDIQPETSSPVNITSNGQGVTNAIQQFITQASLPSRLVEEVLLAELNAIFEPDGHFDRIVVQQHDNKSWEVYLVEANKGPIALSQSGSGIKTIILVLSYLYLVPKHENK